MQLHVLNELFGLFRVPAQAVQDGLEVLDADEASLFGVKHDEYHAEVFNLFLRVHFKDFLVVVHIYKVALSTLSFVWANEREKRLLVTGSVLTLLFVVLRVGVDPLIVVESSDVDVRGLVPRFHILLPLIVAILNCDILLVLPRLLLSIHDGDLLLILTIFACCVFILELLLLLVKVLVTARWLHLLWLLIFHFSS